MDSNVNKKQEKILELLRNANKELEKYYAGKYKFSVSDNNKDALDNIKKLPPKRKRKIKEIWLEFDSELCRLQRQYNLFLQDSLEKNEDK